MEVKQWKNCSEFLPVIILRFEMVLFLLLYPAIKGISVVSVIWMLLQRLGQGAAGEGRGNAEIEGGNFGKPRRCWRLQLASISGSHCAPPSLTASL